MLKMTIKKAWKGLVQSHPKKKILFLIFLQVLVLCNPAPAYAERTLNMIAGSFDESLAEAFLKQFNADVPRYSRADCRPVGNHFMPPNLVFWCDNIYIISGSEISLGSDFVVEYCQQPYIPANQLTAIKPYCPGHIDHKKNLGTCNSGCGSPVRGNPIQISIGNKYQEETDYTGSGVFPLAFKRFYNSDAAVQSVDTGEHWRHSYSRTLEIHIGKALVYAYRPDGKIYTFNFYSDLWNADVDVTDRLQQVTDSGGTVTGWRYILADDTVEQYNTSGQLVSISNRAGLTQTLFYDVAAAEGGDDDPQTLDRIADPFNRTLTLGRDAGGRIASLTDPAGHVYRYDYDANGNLIAVHYPDATPADPNDDPVRGYHYEDANFVHALTGITDENGNRFASWGYDDQGRAVYSEHAGGAGRVDITYNADETVTVVNSQGQANTYHLNNVHGTSHTAQIDGDPCPSCAGHAQSLTYDANGYIAGRTDFNGNTTTYVHDARGLETSRTEAVGTPQERTITTQWDPVFRLPVQITEPGKITTFTYDAQGRLLERKEEAAP